MNDTDKFSLEFAGVYVQAPNSVLVTSEVEDLSAKEVDHAYVYLHYDGTWYQLAQWADAVVSMAHVGPPTVLFFLTANGKVFRRAGGKITEELIDPSNEGPSDLLQMRKLIAVGEELVAVGMARRAYRRSTEGTWSRIDETCFVPRSERTEATGFNDVVEIDGGLLAVGLKGEIWHYDGKVWRKEASPTEVTLTCVTRAADRRIVIGGLGGVLITGHPGTWSILDHGKTRADFWSAVTFGDKAMLSTTDGIFALAGTALEPVPLGAAAATRFLSAVPGKIWSVGGADALSSTDGVTWVVEPRP